MRGRAKQALGPARSMRALASASPRHRSECAVMASCILSSAQQWYGRICCMRHQLAFALTAQWSKDRARIGFQLNVQSTVADLSACMLLSACRFRPCWQPLERTAIVVLNSTFVLLVFGAVPAWLWRQTRACFADRLAGSFTASAGGHLGRNRAAACAYQHHPNGA